MVGFTKPLRGSIAYNNHCIFYTLHAHSSCITFEKSNYYMVSFFISATVTKGIGNASGHWTDGSYRNIVDRSDEK